ncbi:MAG: molybdate ABC transporter substrate-binding protein [Caldilineaceae bacterium]|nr:molybdate ABC transporter substrate-binding protein [Caldilineaceae bacterium]
MRRGPLTFVWLLIFALLGGCIAAPAATAPAETGKATAAPVEEDANAEEAAPTGELIVFAAASLTDAFTQIGTDFQAAYPDTSISYNFAGSQQLAQQLGQGAPADLFASANARQMEVVIEEGRVVSDTQRTFVRNRLVVITPADNPAAIQTLHDLTKPGIKLVLAAAEVPVGGYSLDFLNKASATVEYGETYSQTVIANVVSYEENVRSVLSKVVLGEADAGIVYTSDIALDASQVNRIDIPDELNTVAAYPIAPIGDAENPELAQFFLDYILSPEGQSVLADYGFIPATGEED